jgi:hypothetical protein
MPLTRMVSQLPEAPEKIINLANSLKFRNTILVFLKVEAVDLFPDNWLYIHADNLQTDVSRIFVTGHPNFTAMKKTVFGFGILV